jgi:hypothetical protein
MYSIWPSHRSRVHTVTRPYAGFRHLEWTVPDQTVRFLVTGRQPTPLSSVLYGIIYKRRSVLAAQLLLREKSDA